MKIVDYVVSNWENLPKSDFNEKELVIVLERCNENWGYGHHSYDGVGVDNEGKIFWCYSSGCSCDGSCGTSHELDLKIFETDSANLVDIDPETLNFSSLSVSCSDY